MAAGWGGPPVAAALTLLLSVGASAPGLLRGATAARSAAALRPAALRAGEGASPDVHRPYWASTSALSIGLSAPSAPISALDTTWSGVHCWELEGFDFLRPRVHRLVTYIFIYEDLVSLACGAVIIWYFAGSFEKNVGTVKHCFLTSAFAILSALLYILLEPVVSWVSAVEDTQGFTPVAFATLGVSTTRSRMRRTLVLGVRVPVVLVPWFILCIAWFIPHSSLLSNLCGLLVGEAYGLGYCFCLDFPESVGSRLDQVFPFTLLRRIPGLKYIPGSLVERRAFESSRINPAPGTYPTQSYCCASPPALPAFQVQHPSAQSQGLQHSCAPGYGHVLGHEGWWQGQAAGHSLTSSPCQARGAFDKPVVPAHAGASPGQCCRQDPQTPAGGAQPASEYPPATAASLSAEFCRVQVY